MPGPFDVEDEAGSGGGPGFDPPDIDDCDDPCAGNPLANDPDYVCTPNTISCECNCVEIIEPDDGGVTPPAGGGDPEDPTDPGYVPACESVCYSTPYGEPDTPHLRDIDCTFDAGFDGLGVGIDDTGYSYNPSFLGPHAGYEIPYDPGNLILDGDGQNPMARNRDWGGWLENTHTYGPGSVHPISGADITGLTIGYGRVGIFPITEPTGRGQFKKDLGIARDEQAAVVQKLFDELSSLNILNVSEEADPTLDDDIAELEELYSRANDYYTVLNNIYENYLDPVITVEGEEICNLLQEWQDARVVYIDGPHLFYAEQHQATDVGADLNKEIGDTLLAAGINTADCDEILEEGRILDPYDTCVEQDVILPNWTTREINDVFFDGARCLYCVVVEAGNGIDCTESYLNSFTPVGIEKILEYYNKVDSAEFFDRDDNTTVIDSLDALQLGSGAFFREDLTFRGSGAVDDYYMPPQPLLNTRILITVDAEELNRIPENPPVQTFQAPQVDLATGERFVVFSIGEFVDMMEKVPESMMAHEKTYSAWALEQDAYIPNFDIVKEVKRLKSFEKELDLYLRENGYSFPIIDKLEIRFEPNMQIKSIKARERGCYPEELVKGFPAFFKKPPMNMQQTMSFVWKLPMMHRDVMARQPMQWLEFYQKYAYPELPEPVYGSDPTAPTEMGSDGIGSVADSSCQAGLDAVENSGKSFMKNTIHSLRDAIVSEFNKNPCLGLDGKIIEDTEKDKVVSRIVDMSLKEYLAGDRFIEELPELLVRGNFGDMKLMYANLMDQMGWCGWVELIKAAVDCVLNALGYEDAVTIILKAALRGMDDDAFITWLVELPPEIQDLIIGAVKDFYPPALSLLQAIIQKTVDGVPPPPRVYPSSYTSAEGSSLALGGPPSKATRVAQDTGYPNPGDFGSLKEAVVSILDTQADLVIESFLESLESFPGASIAVAAIEKIDKFCAVPPLFSPPLRDYIKLPQLQTNICNLQVAMTMPDFPKMQTSDMTRLIFKNLQIIIEELLIRLVIIILSNILKLIMEELCKDRTQDPVDIRDALVSSLCEGGSVSTEDANAAMTDIISSVGCIDATPEMVGRMIDNISAVITQCELLDLIQGNASSTTLKIVRETIAADPMTEPLVECFPDDESIGSFFAAMGTFMNLDLLCTVEAFDLPISDSLCDDLGLLQTFSDTRAALLREKGVSEECIQDQLCSLRDRLGEELESLTELLQNNSDLSNYFPNLICDPEDPTCKGLLPYIDPVAAQMASSVFTALFGSMDAQFTFDLIGPEGFMTMTLSDSRGAGLQQHSFLEQWFGPSFLNIYGSRGTRINPPALEWKDIRNPDTTRAFWTIPFLFNPYGVEPPDPDDDEANDDETGAATVGQPPAIGGYPDKVAGHLQDELDPEWGQGRPSCMAKEFDKDSNDGWSMILKYNDYRMEVEKDKLEPYEFEVKYDYWADGDLLSNRCRVQVYDELVYWRVVLPYDPINNPAKPFIEFESSDFLDEDTSNLITSLNNVQTPNEVWGEFFADQWNRALESTPVSAGAISSIRDYFENDTFNEINDGFFVRISEKISTNNTGFTFGYDGAVDVETGTPTDNNMPQVVYFHQDPDLGLSLEEAVIQYGGTEENPPFYIKEPEHTGWLKLSEQITPELKSCDDISTRGSSLGNFTQIRDRCDELVKKVKDDDRYQLVTPRYKIVEEPFDRMLKGMQLAAIEGTINSTIRVYLLENMLKGLAVFSMFKPKFGDLFTDIFSSYVVEEMLDSMIEIGRGKRYNMNFPYNRRYMLSFLEMVVQIFQKRIDIGEITNETPQEREARIFLFSKVESDWEPPSLVGGDPILNNAIKRDNLFDFLDDPEIIENAKILLRRYVSEELERAAESFIERNKPPINNMVDIFFGNDNWIYKSLPGGGPVHVSRDTNYENDYLIDGDFNNWPFVLEKYIRVTDLNPAGSRDSNLYEVVNLEEFYSYLDTLGGNWTDHFEQLSMGLRISYVPSPSELNGAGIQNLESSVETNTLFMDHAQRNKGFSHTTRYLTPLVSTEIPLKGQSTDLSINRAMMEIENYAQDYLPELICNIIEEPEYKMLFKYCFPLERILSVFTIYCLRAFLPSIARGGPTREAISDTSNAVAEYAGNYTYNDRGGDGWFNEGGSWVGIGKGFRCWDKIFTFKESKYVSKQIFNTALHVGIPEYIDEDMNAPGEAYAKGVRTSSNEKIKINWWMWPSLRPPPCKE
jgi:hypothetical protein